MGEFINTAKDIYFGKTYFKEHEMASDYDIRPHLKELSPYFAKRGFKVSMMYNDYFSRWSKIVSDQYVSADLYYFYIVPCLNKWDYCSAYTDKNLFSILLKDVRQPRTLIKCRNGLFYDDNEKPVTREMAVDICQSAKSECGFIIKPTVDTCNGVGVSVFNSGKKEDIEKQFNTTGAGLNFIVQFKVAQHKDVSRLNSTSLNACRIHTYRTVSGKIVVLERETFLRIGGKNAVVDNMSSGGGACQVYKDGTISDVFVRYNTMRIGSTFNEYEAEGFRVPCLDKMNDFAIRAHERLPFFDLIGWDIALNDQGEPVMIEYNVIPNFAGPQQIGGPLFENYIDEIMDRVCCVKRHREVCDISEFRSGYKYSLQIG